MSISVEILDAAVRVLGDSADIHIERATVASTNLRAIAKQTGYTESKTIVHGTGYLADSRIWAKSVLDKITIPASSAQDHV